MDFDIPVTYFTLSGQIHRYTQPLPILYPYSTHTQGYGYPMASLWLPYGIPMGRAGKNSKKSVRDFIAHFPVREKISINRTVKFRLALYLQYSIVKELIL